MVPEIKLTEEELGLMSIFQSVTGVAPRDCIIDSQAGRIIFILNKGQMGLAIGKKGRTIMGLEKTLNKPVELVEWSDDPSELIKNALGSKEVLDIKITTRADKTKVAIVQTSPKNKGMLLGKGGRNVERARMIAKRYFDIEHIHIVTQ